jgi:hypothetical protein
MILDPSALGAAIGLALLMPAVEPARRCAVRVRRT